METLSSKDQVGVVMLVKSGESTDHETGIKFRHFDYKPAFFGPKMRVAWDADTMDAVLPRDTADYLLKNGYARAMSAREIEAYNARVPQEQPPEDEPAAAEEPAEDKPPEKSHKSKKGDKT